MHTPRETGPGGSVALICSSHLNPHKLSIKNFASFESIAIKFKCPQPFIVSVIYRPPSSSLTSFLDHFTDYLSLLTNLNCPLILIGDFNIHTNIANIPSSNFLELLDLFNLSQFSHSPTHISGNTLDLVISSNPIQSLTASDSLVSDHFLLKFDCLIPHTRPTQSSTSISFRKLSQINFSNFNSSLTQLLPSLTSPSQSPTTLCDYLFSSLQVTLDSYAPLISRSIKNRPNTQWYTDELKRLKCTRRACERRLHYAR